MSGQLAQVMEWHAEGTALLEQLVHGTRHGELREASALDGWSRQHVVTHLARNADALGNLCDWARTGIETPMYPNPESRNRDIDRGSQLPERAAIDDLLRSVLAYGAKLDLLTEQAWSAKVTTAQGRVVSATTIPWLRVRELWIHAVDLQLGYSFSDVPTELAEALLDDAIATINARGVAKHLELSAAGSDRSWILEAVGDRQRVSGSLGGLLGYVLRNRTDPAVGLESEHEAPAMPRWL
jgi:maleylpyruvate isomerase